MTRNVFVLHDLHSTLWGALVFETGSFTARRLSFTVLPLCVSSHLLSKQAEVSSDHHLFARMVPNRCDPNFARTLVLPS